MAATMKLNGRTVEYLRPSFVRRIVEIAGPSSGAAQAMADYSERKRAGEDVHIFKEGRFWVVGPAPTSELRRLGVDIEELH